MATGGTTEYEETGPAVPDGDPDETPIGGLNDFEEDEHGRSVQRIGDTDILIDGDEPEPPDGLTDPNRDDEPYDLGDDLEEDGEDDEGDEDDDLDAIDDLDLASPDDIGAEEEIERALRGITSKKVRNRIAREIRLKREIRAERDTLQQQLARSRAETQLADLRRQKSELAYGNHMAALFDERIKAAKEAVILAREQGETRDQVDAETTLQQLQENRRQLDGLLRNQPTIEQLDRQIQQYEGYVAQYGDAQHSDPGDVSRLPPLAQRWVRQNRRFWDLPDNDPRKAYFIRLDETLAAKGYDTNSARYYHQLTRLMQEQFPKIQFRHIDGRPAASGTRKRGGTGRRSVVAAPSAAAAANRAAAGRKRFVLTPQDRRQLMNFGLDPDDPKVVAEYISNKEEGEAGVREMKPRVKVKRRR